MKLEFKLSHSNLPNSSNDILELQASGDFFTDAVTQLFQWLLFGVICQLINIFGVGTNIVNVICFIKQGFQDPVNVSLTGLAISDIGCLATLTWTNICFTPAFAAADLPFDPKEFQYLTSGMPHATFTRITSWITAFITLERCLCITMPLTVRELFTKHRVSAVMICMFLLNISSVSPLYVVNKLGMKYFSQRNKTILGLIYGDNREQIESVSYTVNNVVVPGAAFIMIIVCTVVLVVYLKRTARWRKKSMVIEQAEKISSRNQKIAKMVLLISALFICCFIPVSVIFLAMSLEPEFSLMGKYRNALTVVGGLCVILESVNSSANILIYYYMSTKYKIAFRELRTSKCLKNYKK